MPASRRLMLLVLLGGSLVLGSVAYVQLFLARPVGSGPAGPVVVRSPFEKPWTERRVLLVGMGDSITAGLGARSLQQSYFQRLVVNPEDEYDDMRGLCLSVVLPQLESENFAISGTTSLQHASLVREKLETQPADVFGLIVLTTGGNDLIHNYGRTPPREGAMYGATLAQAESWIANFETRLGEMLDTIAKRFPGGCEIYLADIYDPTDGVGDAPSVYLPDWPDGLAIHARYNEAIHRCAATREHVHVVPLYDLFLGHGSHCRQFWRSTYDATDPHYWYYDNIEDPNDRGYDAIRRAFLNTILAHSQLAPRGPQTALP
jgi:lysophospholipase L1-like esterase